MNYFYKKTHQGFTLIETLFAVLIFSAALISLMIISARGIAATYQIKNEITAHYLAQEGIEIVRAIRDTNFLLAPGNPNLYWDDSFYECEISSPCTISYSSVGDPQLVACSTAPNCSIDNFPGFNRIITVAPNRRTDDNVDDHEYEVTSRVTWNAKTINRSVELKTLIKNWR